MAGLFLNYWVWVRLIRIRIIRYVRQWERRSLRRRKLEFAGVSLLLMLGMIISVLPAPFSPVRVSLNKTAYTPDPAPVGRIEAPAGVRPSDWPGESTAPAGVGPSDWRGMDSLRSRD